MTRTTIMNERFQWVLGIESSCDETAVAILNEGKEVVSNLIASQVDIHRSYGGVVPELASRRHMETLNYLIENARSRAGIELTDLDGIAVSKGPGLVGALIVGVSAAKALAYGLGIPFAGINHVEGHIYANWLARRPPEFPALGLIVSGGHTALMIMEGHGKYRALGQTRDDAAGEAYDKVARALGLGYPGGPVLDKLALTGDPGAYSFPKVYLRDGSWNFSFSGLKTAVLNLMNQCEMKGQAINKADIAASFQEVVTECLTKKAVEAAMAHGIDRILLAGGVAANSALRRKITAACELARMRVYIPEPALCTDNAAMIACAGYHRLSAGFRDDLTMNAEPSLDMMM
jgi:N6-L-threonylcarbamoyladenine synthase